MVALDLPCTFFMLRAVASLPVVEPAARHFSWAPAIVALARKVTEGIAAATGASSGLLKDKTENTKPVVFRQKGHHKLKPAILPPPKPRSLPAFRS